ncbi:MAG: branched-chain amino acid ABC transporter permease [Planctomycetes bacterium]|nr:branched-chain amino acid ABC transporter permease [Planctomycetota bacterium]
MNAKSIPKYLIAHPIATGFVVICAFLPLIVSSPYFIRVLTEVFFFAAMGCAWNIIGGFGKQTSWASASFLAVGGYTSMLIYMRLDGVWPAWLISPWVTIFAGMMLSVLLAVIIGLPCFRFRGVFFAIATIACVTIVRQLLIYFRSFTGGTLGLALNIRTRDNFLDMAFLNDEPYYYITLAWMLIVVLITVWVERSRLGYYLKAMSEDQDAAESLGIRSHRMKLKAFIISSVILSATGTLYTFKMAYTDPNLIASFDISVRIGITAILGGMGTIWGPVLGSLVCIPMLEVSNYYLADFGGGGAGYALYGLLIVLVVLFRPNGVISLYYGMEDRVKAWLAAKRPAPATRNANGGEA